MSLCCAIDWSLTHFFLLIMKSVAFSSEGIEKSPIKVTYIRIQTLTEFVSAFSSKLQLLQTFYIFLGRVVMCILER